MWYPCAILPGMGAAGLIIIGVILFGMIAGGIAQLVLGVSKVSTMDWSLAFFAGIIGSFVGGILHGLITEHRFTIVPSGLIFSVIGAIIVTALWTWFKKSRTSH